MMRQVLLFMLISIFGLNNFVKGQQDGTLFFMHSTPQANFVNPAIQNKCQWMLGLPVLSSVHLEFGNSGFTIMQSLQKQSNNTLSFSGNTLINDLGRTNYINVELHSNLFFLSFWKGRNFFTFSVNEKADLFVTYPKDAFALAWNGNSQFVGKSAELSRTGLFLNYRREYAFGIARQANSSLAWGIRGKLLFGKLNAASQKSNISLFTEANTYIMDFNSNWQLNTSLPISVSSDANNIFQSATYRGGSVGSILFNNKNIGLAFDLGFVKKINDEITISGSLLDIGVIRWVSDGYSFAQHGQFTYSGPGLTDTARYFTELLNTIKSKFGIYTAANSYYSYLNPTYYFGATYNFSNSFNVGALTMGKISRFKITTGMMLSANKTYNERVSLSVSYSYLYRSFSNIGAGVKIGKSPIQFYAVSDNILGLIKPLDTRNINLRFGLQFNFGCSQREESEENIDNCGCGWLKKANRREKREERLLHRKPKF